MYNTEAMNPVSVERFAAFLDGNLSEEDMQSIASAIDSDSEYSAVLSEVMSVDDTVDDYMNHQDVLQDEVLNMDFDLPVIPVSLDALDNVDLFVAHPAAPPTLQLVDEGIHPALETAEHPESLESMHTAEYAENESSEDFELPHTDDDMNDFVDLA